MRARIISALGLYRYDFLVPDYMFMLTTALIVGAFLTLRRCRKMGIPEEHAYQAVFYAILLVFVGGRAVYAFQYWNQFAGNPWELVDPASGGIALYGGMFGLLAGPALYLWGRGVALGPYFDASAPAMALGLCLGRVGCFLAGCNWGNITDLPWGVRFPPPNHAYAQHLQMGLIPRGSSLSLPVHPTQLYEAAFGLAMFFVVCGWLRRSYSPTPSGPSNSPVAGWVPGSVLLAAVSCYAAFRFSMEFLRADAAGLRFGPLSVAQGISLAVLSTTLLTWLAMRDRAGKPTQQVPRLA